MLTSSEFGIVCSVFICIKVKYTNIAVRKVATPLREHYGITQCYLPPGRGDIPALTPAEAGTQLSDPGGMQGRVDLVSLLHTEMVYPPEDGTNIILEY